MTFILPYIVHRCASLNYFAIFCFWSYLLSLYSTKYYTLRSTERMFNITITKILCTIIPIYYIFKKMVEAWSKSGWWTKYSEIRLIDLENRILSVLTSIFKTWYVHVGPIVGEDDKIWTVLLNKDSQNTPLVLLHGFAAGLGFWCKNFDDLAKDRPVYAIDLLGFGRSSRPHFAKKCEDSEQQMVDSIEAWRKQLNLEKFILLGHSFGGYLATSYAINHPDRVKHLILADPWGFSEIPPHLNLSLRLRVLSVILYPFTYFNPLAAVRATGPLGPWLVKKMRGDISLKYDDVLSDSGIILEYIYQCNSQYPSGETAFHSFISKFAYAKNPMIRRFDKIKSEIPITVMFGQYSWISKESAITLRSQRPNSYVNIEVIPNAGHHLYSDRPKLFNKIVNETCKISDLGLDVDNTYAKEIPNNLLNDTFRWKFDKYIEEETKEMDEEEQEAVIKGVKVNQNTVTVK
ncbi:1-acylglycerol-3-phosphate O-acyltransferase ABHD5-like [Cylas formicarius]|uniref:1-acylglycerol-3-phosphate O-acyltransferase ABHD5-like n=1 Tax=Cylas formicarius TaxID=197179 RepID=UPI002958D413|nr:1-acylglycerol-3-phosphate O-acyltransferase ABHD5-like [Cylas formicarius]